MTAESAREAPNAWLRESATVLAVAGFLAFTNPFGATADLPAWAGFLYWALLVAIGWFGGNLIGDVCGRLAPGMAPLPRRALATALVAVIIAGAIIAIQQAIGAPVPRYYWPTLYVLVLGISIGVAAISWLTRRAFAENAPGAVTHAPAPGAAAEPVRFLERLPAKLRGAEIYAVEAEDHYLRLHTSKGSDLILMRLADAVAELDGLEGAQVHRSWWVSRDGFESVSRDGAKITLKLKSGADAPVSRPNVKPLRAAGWL